MRFARTGTIDQFSEGSGFALGAGVGIGRQTAIQASRVTFDAIFEAGIGVIVFRTCCNASRILIEIERIWWVTISCSGIDGIASEKTAGGRRVVEVKPGQIGRGN